jgi:yecA family protein
MSHSCLNSCLAALSAAGSDESVWRVLRSEGARLVRDPKAGIELASRVAAAPKTADKDAEFMLLETVIEQARMDTENGGSQGSAFLAALDDAITHLCDQGGISRAGTFHLGRCYVRAGLQPPKRLQRSGAAEMARMLDPGEFADINELLDRLRDEAQGDDAYSLHAALREMLATIDPEIRGMVVSAVVDRDEPIFDRLGLYWLLDSAPDIRGAAAGAFFRRAQTGRLDASLASRLIEMRNWLPADAARDRLDRALKEALKREVAGGIEPRPWKFHRLLATVPDGAGAQSVMIAAQQGSKRGIAMLLLKQGLGVKDAYVIPCRTATEQKQMLAQIVEEMDALEVMPEFVEPALAAALAEGAAVGEPPAHGLVDIVEVTGIRGLQPKAMSVEDWIGHLDPEGTLDRLPLQTFGRLVNASADWPDEYDVVQSWFEDSSEVRQILINAITPRSRTNALRRHLETRREWWSRLIAKTAATVNHDAEGTRGDWKSFAATAMALVQGRPLSQVPIMKWVIESTLEAAEDPWGDMRGNAADAWSAPPENDGSSVTFARPAPEKTGELARLMQSAGMDITPPWLDGYLTAIVVAPKMIKPTDWIGSLLGQSHNFADHDQLQRFLDLILYRYNEANADTVDPESNKTRVDPLDDALFRQWSAGFSDCVVRHKVKWTAGTVKKDDKAILKLLADMAAGRGVASDLKPILPAWISRRRAVRS